VARLAWSLENSLHGLQRFVRAVGTGAFFPGLADRRYFASYFRGGSSQVQSFGWPLERCSSGRKVSARGEKKAIEFIARFRIAREPTAARIGLRNSMNILSCVRTMERKPVVAPPAPHAAKGPKRKQAQQTVRRMQFGWLEVNRCAFRTLVTNPEQMG